MKNTNINSNFNKFIIATKTMCFSYFSMGLSWQEHWNDLPVPPPGDLPNPGIERVSPLSPELAGRFFTTEPPGKSRTLPPGISQSYSLPLLLGCP